MTHYDVVVAGGGMVGALTAALLANNGLSVLVVERFDITAVEVKSQPSLRTSAFSHFSIELLKQVGAWQYVNESRRAPYTGLQTWEDERHALCFDAKDINADYLGHILENNLVQQALWRTFESHGVTLCCPATVESFVVQSNCIDIQLDNGEHVVAKLLVGADGGQSRVRQMANIGVDGWQYQQHCMAINVQMSESHPPVTWQAFYPSGPRAYLPLFDQYASLIWYDAPETINQLLKLDDQKLKARILQAFPDKLGDFTILQTGAFPLTRMHAKNYYTKHLVLVGDAAHTINPLAGQGVNLGFKDANELTKVIKDAVAQGDDIFAPQVLARYQKIRYKHNLLMMSAMDMCYVGFSNDIKPLAKLRQIGLGIANRTGFIKTQVMKYAM